MPSWQRSWHPHQRWWWGKWMKLHCWLWLWVCVSVVPRHVTNIFASIFDECITISILNKLSQLWTMTTFTGDYLWMVCMVAEVASATCHIKTTLQRSSSRFPMLVSQPSPCMCIAIVASYPDWNPTIGNPVAICSLFAATITTTTCMLAQAGSIMLKHLPSCWDKLEWAHTSVTALLIRVYAYIYMYICCFGLPLTVNFKQVHSSISKV